MKFKILIFLCISFFVAAQTPVDFPQLVTSKIAQLTTEKDPKTLREIKKAYNQSSKSEKDVKELNRFLEIYNKLKKKKK